MRAKPFVCAVFFTTALPALAEEREAAPGKPETRVAVETARGASARAVPFVLPARSVPVQRPSSSLLMLDRENSVTLDLPDEQGPSARPGASAQGLRRVVSDALDDHPKPRKRGSMLSAALVLRIDGDSDSPPVSVGGGGVAGVLWRAVPRR